MKNESKKAAATVKNAKSLKFETAQVDEHFEKKDIEFFQFKAEGETFIGKFLAIRPETHPIQGLDFMEIDADSLENIGEKTMPSYSNLLKYFSDKAADETKVYQITLAEIKTLDKGRRVYLFEIGVAIITE